MTSLLEPIGFSVVTEGEALAVTPPTFRPDVRREVDVIEEVARHHGYAAIARTERRSPKVGRLTDGQRERRELRRTLQGIGASEGWTSSLVDPALLGRLDGTTPALRVLNPVVSGEDTLRTHLFAGLLAALERNAARRSTAVRLFEIGKVFSVTGGVPDEHEHLGLVLSAPGEGAASAVAAWRRLTESARVDLAATIERPLAAEELAGIAAGMHPSRSAVIASAAADGGVIGAIGEIDPEVALRFGLSEAPIGAVIIDLEAFYSLPRRDPHARPVSRYPSADIDLAFALAEAVPAYSLERCLQQAAGERLESIELLDVYRGAGLPDESRSLAYRLRLSALDHTLSEQEITEVRTRCIATASSELSATLRA